MTFQPLFDTQIPMIPPTVHTAAFEMPSREIDKEGTAFPFENPRQAVIDAALDAAHEEWKAAYERYILSYASVSHEPFSAEDVRLRYEQSHGPQTKKQQASGGIFQRLAKQGKLIAVGKKRSKKYGNDLTSYRKGI